MPSANKPTKIDTGAISIKPIVVSNEKKIIVHEDLPATVFRMVIVGTSGSGKSVLMENFFGRKDMYRKAFKTENMVIISPSLEVHDPFPMLSQAFKVSESNKFAPTIDKLLDHVSEMTQIHGAEKIPATVVILDDCSCEKNLFGLGGPVDRLFVTGRNYNISTCVVAHRLNLLSRNTKLNLNAAILFPTVNYTEIESFVEQFVEKKKRPIVQWRMNEVFAKKYQFIYINTQFPREEQLRAGFHDLLVTPEDEARFALVSDQEKQQLVKDRDLRKRKLGEEDEVEEVEEVDEPPRKQSRK